MTSVEGVKIINDATIRVIFENEGITVQVPLLEERMMIAVVPYLHAFR